jgi:cyclopropane fatty-acyl-phospholipid synthase-like methyltransferase
VLLQRLASATNSETLVRLHSPAAERNREPILDVLRRVLPPAGHVLEIASGSGQHVVHFARALPLLSFQPTDASEDARRSIDAERDDAGLPNILPARALDVLSEGWEAELGRSSFDAMVCINMIHIAPWEATLALFAGASTLLAGGAPLVLYGPFRFHGAFLAASNAEFSRSLGERNSSWGVRDVDDVEVVARRNGFDVETPIGMPANNHVLVCRRHS